MDTISLDREATFAQVAAMEGTSYSQSLAIISNSEKQKSLEKAKTKISEINLDCKETSSEQVLKTEPVNKSEQTEVQEQAKLVKSDSLPKETPKNENKNSNESAKKKKKKRR